MYIFSHVFSQEAEPPVQLSDRRLGKAVRLLRLSASLCGASEVCELDAGHRGQWPGTVTVVAWGGGENAAFHGEIHHENLWKTKKNHME